MASMALFEFGGRVLDGAFYWGTQDGKGLFSVPDTPEEVKRRGARYAEERTHQNRQQARRRRARREQR